MAFSGRFMVGRQRRSYFHDGDLGGCSAPPSTGFREVEFDDGIKARDGIAEWMKFYNEERPHSLFDDDRTPMEEYHRRMAA